MRTWVPSAKAPVTHAALYNGGEMVVTPTGSRHHERGPGCWCKPFIGLYDLFHELQGERKLPVLCHRNYEWTGTAWVSLSEKSNQAKEP